MKYQQQSICYQDLLKIIRFSLFLLPLSFVTAIHLLFYER